jgi:hypothetical protein
MLGKERENGLNIGGRENVFCYFLLLLFLLKEKVTKSSSEFDGGDCLVRSFPMTNSQAGDSFRWVGLRFDPLIRAIRSFMEALYFSLPAIFSPNAFCK